MNLSLQTQWTELQQKIFQLWNSKLEPRYQALDEREQRMVRIAAITLPLIIFVFGILLPVADRNAQLRLEVKVFSMQAQEANQLADMLARTPQLSADAGKGSALTRVDKIARQTDVRSFMTKLRPQQVMGGTPRLQTQIKDAPYSKVVDFLSALEKSNLSISQLKIQAASVGHVHLQAVISG